jgi:hypothetical protein
MSLLHKLCTRFPSLNAVLNVAPNETPVENITGVFPEDPSLEDKRGELIQKMGPKWIGHPEYKHKPH